ncbi:MAG: YggT family protein [Chlamydiales bacterium]|nr:YggT family protein [Chlamydiales bacterium]
MLAYLIHILFFVYTALIFVRVVGSWFPAFAGHPIMLFIKKLTDPYLNAFRRIIPPIGGALDLSPLLGFFVLQIAEQFILRFFR